jgi:hypothetical protein
MCEGGHVGVEVEDPKTSTGPQDSNEFGDGSLSSRNVGEHRHTHHRIKGTIGQRQSKRVALAKLYPIADAGLFGQLAGHRQ